MPRSGWLAISSTAQPPTPRIGPPSARRLRLIFGRAASTPATCSTSATFITSLGWNCSGPAPSQRRAPLICSPMPGSRTAISMANEAKSSSRVCLRKNVSGSRDTTCMPTSPTAPYIRYLTRYEVPSPEPSSSVRAELAE